MAINIYTDASLKSDTKESRGAYVITMNKQPGFGKDLNYKKVHTFRTETVKADNAGFINDMELRTILLSIKHALKLYPEATHIKVYSDSLVSIDKLNAPWHIYVRNGIDPEIKGLWYYLKKIGKDGVQFKFIHVKAHKGNLSDMPSKMNFVCDLLARI